MECRMKSEFVGNYLREFSSGLEQIPAGEIEGVATCLLDTYLDGRWVYLAGNGGSAALASHFACDLEKTVAGRRPREVERRFRVVSLVDNLASLTAWSNDEGYEHAFSEPLRSRAQSDELLIVISASGNSPNIVAALEAAKDLGMRSVGLLGFDGGRARALCDRSIHVHSHDYGIVEGVHSVLVHLLTTWLAKATSEHRAAVDMRQVG